MKAGMNPMKIILPIKICLSKRPGLISAGSRISGRLVPAKMTTFVVVLKPDKVITKTQSLLNDMRQKVTVCLSRMYEHYRYSDIKFFFSLLFNAF